MIPKEYIEKNLAKAKGAIFFGVPVEKLTRNELIACAVGGWEGQTEMIQQARKDYKVLNKIN